jgi:hypothetical protein
MPHRTVFPLVLLTAIGAVFFTSPLRAQLPRRLERCQPAKPKAPKVAIDTILFENSNEVPESIQKLLITAVTGHQFEDYTGSVDELTETVLRGVLQDHGYFRVDLSTCTRILSQGPGVERVSLSVRVDLGPQYRMGSLQFRSADPDQGLLFSVDKLRKLLLLNDGDIFDVSKLRQALDALKNLYSSVGYIDFTPVPSFDINDEQKQLNLTLELDQQRQYRVGRIEFLGNDAETEEAVRSKLRTGEVFDFSLVREFYAQNKSVLPPEASPKDDEFQKDVMSGVVNMRFDFSTCPTE